MENMKLWDSVFVTDPAAVKAITGKQYKGSSPKPYWIIQRATETFGPCGIGWGIEVLNERFERLTDTDVLHVALIRVWYMDGEKRGSVEQMGQTKACYKTNSGTMMIDEDAPKKSVTDGMVKCLSMLGFAGDIFSGRWDDSKYIEFAAKETAKRLEGNNNPMPEKSVLDYIAGISGATTVDELETAFIAAKEAATKFNDKAAYKRIVKATNERKAFLEKAAA